MLVILLISLYSSRLLLKELGIDDFGIYGVVGGIVAMFSSLKTMFSEATERFLNVEIGKNNTLNLIKIFNISIYVNFIIIIVFVVLVEFLGLWLIEAKLQIPIERHISAYWVFHISVLSAVITILNVPFDACIIAHEKMNIFAFVSVFDSIARFIIILLLPFWGGDRLILYSVLLLFVVLTNLFINSIYCYCNFAECRIRKFPVRDIEDKFKEMFSFSGWAFLGNLAFALTNEGMNILLNIFGGTMANASRTIAYQVRGAIFNLTGNVYTAVKPQAIQSYAKKEIDRYYTLSFTGGKAVGYFFLLLSIPIYFSLEELLKIWLTEVPQYSIQFVTSLFVYMFVRSIHGAIDLFFVTIGKFRYYQIAEFLMLSSSLFLAFVGFKYYLMPLYGAFMCMAFSEVLNTIVILSLAKSIGNFRVFRFVKDVLIPYCIMALLCFIICYFLRKMMDNLIYSNINLVFLYVFVSFIAQSLCMFSLGLNKEEKALFLHIVRHKNGKN